LQIANGTCLREAVSAKAGEIRAKYPAGINTKQIRMTEIQISINKFV